MTGDRLTRDLDDAMLGGVLAGAARRWDLDATLLRLLALIAIIPTGGLAIVLYLAAWMLVPRPDQLEEADASAPAAPRPLRERLRPGEVATAAREAGDAARRAADRISDAARLASEAARTAADAARTAADAARTVAEELSDIAHQPARRADAPAPADTTTAGAGRGADAQPDQPSAALAGDDADRPS
jgi:phage shock protein PspC (stress-responsive transcriptional regulator)